MAEIAPRTHWDHLFADSLTIDLDPDWWKRAIARAHRIARNGQTDLRTNKFWTGVDLAAHGMVCEAAFGKFYGVPADWTVGRQGRSGQPDVAGFEVKSSAWYSINSFATWEGGNLWIQDHAQARAVVVLTVFRQSREHRVYLDGWLPMTAVRLHERVPGKGRRGVSYRVPYGALRSWRTIPKVGA